MNGIENILNLISSDNIAQRQLSELAQDSLNNNVSLIHIHPKESEIFSETLETIKSYVFQNKEIFLGQKTFVSDRVNYAHIYSLSNGNIDDIAKYLTIILASEKMKNTDDYLFELANNDDTIINRYNLLKNSAGMICLSDYKSKMTLKRHAIDMHDGTCIYLHQFLRRGFTAHFADTPEVIMRALNSDYNVEARIDPFRVGDIKRYREITECDYWHGPKFNQKLLDSRRAKEEIAEHAFKKDQKGLYTDYRTVFRTSMLDGDHLRQISIEEYIPKKDWAGYRTHGYGNNKVIQRFAHLVYDQNKHSFEHIDCAVRIFDKNTYDNIYAGLLSGKMPDRQIGTRFKLLKISGNINVELIKDLLYAFFRNNPHLMEYFCNLSYEEVRKSFTSR